jgi:hypothetical protein
MAFNVYNEYLLYHNANHIKSAHTLSNIVASQYCCCYRYDSSLSIRSQIKTMSGTFVN